MNRSSTFIWITLILLILLPTAAGRFIVDLASGLLVFFILLPFILGGAGWVGWKILKSRMNTCNACGASFLNQLSQCPICGSNISNSNNLKNELSNVPASSVTIDITPEEKQ